MAIYPVILDSCPHYLRGAAEGVSIALLPHGAESVATHVARALFACTQQRATLVRSFPSTAAYEARVTDIPQLKAGSRSAADFRRELAEIEPSDWVLVVDPRTFPSVGFDDPELLEELLDELLIAPRITRHLVALGETEAGTSERVEFDVDGRVRRIQRSGPYALWFRAALQHRG